MGLRVSGQACDHDLLRVPLGASSPQAFPGPLRPPPSGVLPHSPSLRGPPEAREAQAGSEAQQCTSRDARPEVRRPAVRRCRSRRVGGAREVRARWPPPARPLGLAAEPAECRGSPPSKSVTLWLRRVPAGAADPEGKTFTLPRLV